MTKQLVVAAGAYSKKFAQQAGIKFLLDVERGYHVEYDMAEPLLNRPCCYAAGGFYMSPMTGRLRVVGTVELGGLSPKISQHRMKHLEKGAEIFFPKLGSPSRTWLGFRPSIPDSRPVISQSSKGNDIVYAFGHGHIGLTLAPITAEIVESILTKTKTQYQYHDFSAKVLDLLSRILLFYKFHEPPFLLNLARRKDIFFIFKWVVTTLEVDFDRSISKFERRSKEIH